MREYLYALLTQCLASELISSAANANVLAFGQCFELPTII